MFRARSVVFLTGIALAGCSGFRDVFTSHADTAARVGSHDLPAKTVAEIITRLGGASSNPEAAEFVTSIWVDIGLFADRVASGTLQTDSATVERMLWPQIAQIKVKTWHDTIVGRRARITDGSIDSVYNGSSLRLFQHILITPGGATPADTAKAKAQAERVVAQARSGNFAKLAMQLSADPGSKADSGYLPPGPKGQFVPEFDAAGWLLQPGQVSDVVKSQFGFHIIRRPPLTEVRGRLTPMITQAETQRQDSAYMAELTAKSELTLKPGAPAAVRSAVTDLGASRKSGKVLASYKNGEFTVADMIHWLGALQAPQLNQIRRANDTLIEMFTKQIAQNDILLQQADSAKMGVSPDILRGMVDQFKSEIAGLKSVTGLDTAALADSSKVPVSEKRKIAERKVDEYFQKLSRNEAQYRGMPPTLSAELRAQGDYRIYQAGISRARELIDAKRREDSAAAAKQPPPPAPGALQPAPGGPPRPGQAPADTGKRP